VTPPRGYPLRGEVHDENSYALGGVSGHAGLFSTASDLSIFAQMMLNGGEYNGTRIVSDSAVHLFARRSAGTRALGWDTCNGDGGCGKYLSERAYGHTGFTGTSLWIDPDRQMFVVLLTNRVHAARARRPAKVISDVRADLSDAAAVAVTDEPDMLLAMPASFRADLARGWNRVEHARRGRYSRASRSAKARRAAAARARASLAAKSRSSRSLGTRSAGGRVVQRTTLSAASKAKAVRSGSRKVSKPSVRKVSNARKVSKPSAQRVSKPSAQKVSGRGASVSRTSKTSARKVSTVSARKPVSRVARQR